MRPTGHAGLFAASDKHDRRIWHAGACIPDPRTHAHARSLEARCYGCRFRVQPGTRMLTIAYKARLIWRRHLANVSGSISGVSLLSTQTRPAASQQTALLQRVAQLAASAHRATALRVVAASAHGAQIDDLQRGRRGPFCRTHAPCVPSYSAVA
jgi:hypothetical protein